MVNKYISRLSKEDVQDFLFSKATVDVQDYVLKTKEPFGIPAAVLATQLSGRKKIVYKIPSWYNTKGIVYPPSINLEQASSEATASFKKQIVKNLLGKLGDVAVDLTGGFGIDSYFLSSLFRSFHYVEANPDLFELSVHNHNKLGVSHIMHHQLLAETFIENLHEPVNLIYLDPSRRDENTRKVFHLKDCSPDITILQSQLLKHTNTILLKASPLLDIQQGLREITHCKKVFVLSVNNECKEVLFLIEKDFEGEPSVEAVDLFEDGRIRYSFSFHYSEERNAASELSEPKRFLYEPSASILKSGAFKLAGNKFELKKLDVSTHIYTSDNYFSNFPGRIFSIETLNPDIKTLHAVLHQKQVNVITRNYPLTPEMLKKKLRLRDGSNQFLLGFTCRGKKMLALCNRSKGI
jgi:hypothetical protein